jgi:hypothetical protein
VDKRVGDSLLVREHVDVHDLTHYSDNRLNETQEESDNCTRWRKLFVLLVRMLHDGHTVADLRRKQEV